MVSDIDFLINRDNLFPQKFDEKIGSLAKEILETALTTSPNRNNSRIIDFESFPQHTNHA